MKRPLLALFALWGLIASLPASGATFTALTLVEDPLAWGVVLASPFGSRGSGLGDVTFAAAEVASHTQSREWDADSFVEEVELPQIARITPASGQIQLMGRNGLGDLPEDQTELVSLSAAGQWAQCLTHPCPRRRHSRHTDDAADHHHRQRRAGRPVRQWLRVIVNAGCMTWSQR